VFSFRYHNRDEWWLPEFPSGPARY